MRRARGVTIAFAALLAAALGVAHTASDSKQVTPVPKPAAAGGGGQKWAVIVGVSDYDDPAIPDLGYSADDARAVYEILTDPQRGGYRPSNVRLLVSGASDPGNRPTRRNIMGRVEVFLSQAGPGDAVLFYFSGHGIEHQEQGYLLPSDAESGPLLPQFAVSLDFLNRSLTENRATQKIVLLDACYSGVGKGIGEGMGATFARSLFASADGRVTLASCGPAEQSYEWPGRSASVFTHYVCDGLSGKADYDSDRSVSLTELHRYVSEQVRRWAADHNKQQNPRMQADVSGEIVLARVPQQAVAPPAPGPRPLVTTATLRVASDPAGAQVMVDGVARGTTPCDVEVDLGAAQSAQVEVVLQKEGYKSQGARITLLRGQTSRWEEVGLEPLLKSLPHPGLPGADVELSTLSWPSAPARALSSDHSPVNDVAFSPDGRLLASASQTGTVHLWDVEGGRVAATLAGSGFAVVSVAFSPDGRLLASATFGSIKLWEVETGRLAGTLRGNEGEAAHLALSPDGQLLASGVVDAISLWEVGSGSRLATLPWHGERVTSVAFSPDGRLLACGSFFGGLQLWEVRSGQPAATIRAHRVYAGNSVRVAFSPDGRLLASGSMDDGAIKLWDAGGTHLQRAFSRPGPMHFRLAFSPDGRLLACASEDGVELWDVGDGHLLTTLEGHGHTSVTFSPDGMLLASGSRDGSVKLWQMPEELWVR